MKRSIFRMITICSLALAAMTGLAQAQKPGSDTLSLAASLAAAVPVAAQSVNLTGDWAVTLRTPKGELNIKTTIKQEGEKLSGMAIGPLGVISEPVQGTIKGTTVKVSSTINDGGNIIPITLTGEVDGDSIKGKADFGGVYEGDWTAQRFAGKASAETNEAPVSSAPSDGKVDVSGTWIFEVESSAGSSSPTFIFKQEGETLTGQFKGAFSEAPLAGTIKGNEIKFSFKVQAQGTEVTVTYIGTIEKNLMKGSLQLGNLDSGTWTAKRK